MFSVWLFFSFMMSVELHGVSLIQADINQNRSLMEPHMQSVITLKTQTQHTNKSSGREFADVSCRGFAVRSRLIFLSKPVLHFDYLVLLKAIQVGLFHSGLFSWD